MSKPLYVRIRQCATPADAILMLATEIEELRAQLNDATPQDPWAAKLDWGASLEQQQREDVALRGEAGSAAQAARKIQRDRLVAALEAKLEEETDPDERRALEAQLRLAKESHVVIPDIGPAKVVKVESENGIIEVPPASPEKVAARMQYAAEHRFVDYLMNAEAVKAGNGEAPWLGWFGKVGPKGLYISDRLAVMKMPIEFRYWLIEDMAEDDVAYAQNMGADILKTDEQLDPEIARKMLEGDWHS